MSTARIEIFVVIFLSPPSPSFFILLHSLLLPSSAIHFPYLFGTLNQHARIIGSTIYICVIIVQKVYNMCRCCIFTM